MMRAILIGVVLASGTALAQPAPEAPVAPAVDPPELDARFQQAMNDFAAGHFAEAAAGFDDVAARTTDAGRRTTATEMSRQAHARMAPPVGVAPPGAEALPPPSPPQQDARLNAHSRDGRYVLLVGTTAMGLTLYGPTLAVLADSSSDKTSVGMYMLGAGSSFFVPYLLTRDEPVSWGMSDAWIYGSTRGALHGGFLLLALSSGQTPTDKEVFGTLSLASLAEGTGFTLWARSTNASAGMTNAMGAGSDFGIGYSLALSSLVLPDSALGDRWAGTAGLLGAGVGYGAGYYYGKLRNPTWGDVEVLRTAGYLGAYASAVPLILGEVENRQVIAATLAVGGTAGLVIGDHLLEGHDFTTGQGIVVQLSTMAGGLTGAGVAYLLTPDSTSGSSEAKILATGAVLGAGAGFLLTYYGLDTTAHPAGSGLTLQIGPDLAHDHKGIVAAGTF